MGAKLPQSDLQRARPWQFQYSLRGLFLAVLVASIAMSCVGIRMQRAKRQGVAVDAILRDGGTVGYDYEFDGPGGDLDDAQPPGPAWLRRLVGIDLLADVVAADLVSDAEMSHLEAFPRIHTLRLYTPDVTDAGLAYVEGLSELQMIGINWTRVSDGGLRHLTRLPHLRTVGLTSSPFTDAGLEHVARLPELKELVLDRTKVTDGGVRKVQDALPGCTIFR